MDLCFFVSRHVVYVGYQVDVRVALWGKDEKRADDERNERAEAKGGRSEARCWVCRMVAFEGACLALEGYGTVEAEEDSPDLCERRPEVW